MQLSRHPQLLVRSSLLEAGKGLTSTDTPYGALWLHLAFRLSNAHATRWQDLDRMHEHSSAIAAVTELHNGVRGLGMGGTA